MRRRALLSALVGGAAATVLPAGAASLPLVSVFKDPNCGCCTAWVDHLKAAGFPVRVTEVGDTGAMRRRHGMPDAYGGCHTGLVEGYVIEGHVPAAEVKRLLEARPAAIGLSVPGMPVGSPGMEFGDRQDPYEVLLVDEGGQARVFARYPVGSAKG